jgi:hypothetical protein
VKRQHDVLVRNTRLEQFVRDTILRAIVLDPHLAVNGSITQSEVLVKPRESAAEWGLKDIPGIGIFVV